MTFVLPGQQVIVASDVTQHALDRVLTATGAIGFEAPDGTVSMLVDNLPEGGTVKVVVPAWLGEPVATQVCQPAAAPAWKGWQRPTCEKACCWNHTPPRCKTSRLHVS